MAIEPTPPAPPRIRIARAAPGTGFATSSRSNIASQAVIDGQGQSRSGGEIERARLAPDDPLVDQMKLHVRALAADAAGVEHFVARLEQLRLAPGLHHHAGGVVADDLDRVRVGGRARAPAARHFVVDRIDRDRAHLNEKVATFRLWPWDIERLEMIELRARFAISDRPHFASSPGPLAARRNLTGVDGLGEKPLNWRA